MKKTAYDKITDLFISELEKGTVPWKNPMIGVNDGAPRNFTTDRKYRGVNTLICGLSPFSSNLFLTFRQAKQLGGKIKKGEKGLPICFYSKIDKENKKGITEKQFILKSYTIFNIEQTEGIDYAKPEKVEINNQNIESADKVWSDIKNKCAPIGEKTINKAFYNKNFDHIGIPEIKYFSSSEEYYSTLFHEATHSTGHHSRLNRKTLMDSHNFGDQCYSKEELVAEIGAAFLCSKAGILDATKNNSASYIKGWLKALKSNKKLIIEASSQAQKSCDYLLSNH